MAGQPASTERSCFPSFTFQIRMAKCPNNFGSANAKYRRPSASLDSPILSVTRVR